MAAYEVLLLNTAIPQIQAAQSGDTYVVPRDIAFSAALTLSAGTANGVAYLNGSKVLTTGSALTFDGTTIKSPILFASSTDAGGSVLQVDTTSTVYGRVGGSTTMGYVAGTQSLWTIGGTEGMRLTSTGLGIGTSSPQAKLHVDGGDFRNSSGTLPALSTSIVSGEIHSGFGNASTSDSGYLRLSAGGGTTLAVKAAIDIFREASGATGVLFYTAGTEQMRLTSTGLGIGTSSPAAKLHVAGTGTQQALVQSTNGGTTSLQLLNSGVSSRVIKNVIGALVFEKDAVDQATLDSSGNLGLGVTPSAWTTSWKAFQFGATSALSDYSNQTSFWNNTVVTGATTPLYQTTAAASLYRQTGGQHLFYTAPSGTAGNAISFTQVLTLDGIDGSGYGKNLKLGGTADRATTKGTHHFDIFDGTAPVGTLANGISIYSSSGEAYVMDAAGNATLFSPHDSETNEWIFRSKHTPTGKVLRIDVERLLRFVNDHFGLDAVKEFVEE